MRRTFLRAALSCFALALPFAASAQEGTAYPSKSVRLIVPFPPGGGTDAIARALADRMAVDLKQSFVIENKPGAGGILGADATARSPADGYTLFVGTNSSLVTNKFLYSKLPYDPDGFELIGLVGITPLVVVINPSVPARNIPELVAYAKANPGKLSYASFGAGTTSHLAAELFKQRAGIDMLHVPYKGAAEALPAIIGGQVSVYFDTIVSSIPHVKSGKLLALGVTSAKRSQTLPNVPSVAEQGYPGYEMFPWYGLVAPKGTPKDVMEKLRASLARALADPKLIERLGPTGAEVTPMTAAEFHEFVRVDTGKTEKVVKAAGVTLN
ncbi:Bug family tripartite tricarboxylate transporter substrate binding protein [Comamonas endophytica]|uniref:Tripartite tricarboxylate transporter substrate binding protein n=1 Tax=Comamonas endophytica TaxID=2949090 RepID=A0ABY6G7S8_9BURK|nr:MULTISPECIES: tripartite tricarboxylate transporter substrate binding protein [unclassified Acidovorax]MCD2514504.1 tripartite tricarboxylate transporter substrate binding protein [Acidovorax sp. D4N7]UYG51084.1 tripartite tricarboxylate transporter substrate binding protein [Acidovorax sp. 5MLIR]